MSRRRLAGTVLTVAMPLFVAGCGGEGSAEDERTLTVLAAASLTDSFTELAAEFEAAHDGVTVRLAFDSSATLAEQALEGAPGDVLATADQRTMDRAVRGGGTDGEARQFATNELVLAVPFDNPAAIRTLADLDGDGVDYLTCVPTAPCGAAATALLESNGVRREPVSQEVDVRAVLAKVAAGEADAGFVYRSDVVASGAAVTGVAVPGAERSPNTYWVAVTASAEEDELAKDWIALLRGDTGRAALAAAGFGPVG